MGNKQSLLEQLQIFSPSNNLVFKQTGNKFKIYQHRSRKYQLILDTVRLNNERQLPILVQNFKARYQHLFLVSTLFLQIQDYSTCGGFYRIAIYYQRIFTNLSRIKDIPFPDVLHFYAVALKGFQILFYRFGYFQIYQDMFHLGQDSKLKVWCNKNISKNQPQQYLLDKTGSEEDMIRKIIYIIDQNTDHQTEKFRFKQKLIAYGVRNFQMANQSFRQILRKNNLSIPQKVNCLIALPSSEVQAMLDLYTANLNQNHPITQNIQMTFNPAPNMQQKNNIIEETPHFNNPLIAHAPLTQQFQIRPNEIPHNNLAISRTSTQKVQQSMIHTFNRQAQTPQNKMKRGLQLSLHHKSRKNSTHSNQNPPRNVSLPVRYSAVKPVSHIVYHQRKPSVQYNKPQQKITFQNKILNQQPLNLQQKFGKKIQLGLQKKQIIKPSFPQQINRTNYHQSNIPTTISRMNPTIQRVISPTIQRVNSPTVNKTISRVNTIQNSPLKGIPSQPQLSNQNKIQQKYEQKISFTIPPNRDQFLSHKPQQFPSHSYIQQQKQLFHQHNQYNQFNQENIQKLSKQQPNTSQKIINYRPQSAKKVQHAVETNHNQRKYSNKMEVSAFKDYDTTSRYFTSNHQITSNLSQFNSKNQQKHNNISTLFDHKILDIKSFAQSKFGTQNSLMNHDQHSRVLEIIGRQKNDSITSAFANEQLPLHLKKDSIKEFRKQGKIQLKKPTSSQKNQSFTDPKIFQLLRSPLSSISKTLSSQVNKLQKQLATKPFQHIYPSYSNQIHHHDNYEINIYKQVQTANNKIEGFPSLSNLSDINYSDQYQRVNSTYNHNKFHKKSRFSQEKIGVKDTKEQYQFQQQNPTYQYSFSGIKELPSQDNKSNIQFTTFSPNKKDQSINYSKSFKVVPQKPYHFTTTFGSNQSLASLQWQLSKKPDMLKSGKKDYIHESPAKKERNGYHPKIDPEIIKDLQKFRQNRNKLK